MSQEELGVRQEALYLIYIFDLWQAWTYFLECICTRCGVTGEYRFIDLVGLWDLWVEISWDAGDFHEHLGII